MDQDIPVAEHPFGAIKRQFGLTKVRFKGLAENMAHVETQSEQRGALNATQSCNALRVRSDSRVSCDEFRTYPDLPQ